MQDTVLTVRRDAPIGTISPRLYGHFAEHLGRCCYDGLWNGSSFRHEVVAALRNLPVPLLRWPGGCYADHYHWRDGVGPTEQRPRRLGMSCGLQVEDDNSLGTHDFLELCRRVGAAAYLAGNVGSGTPQELADWLEYCNSESDTQLTRERRSNGRARPFGVRLWGVGNENWGTAGAAPLPTRRVLFQDLSLPGQPRDRSRPLREMLAGEGIGPGTRVGVIGWKSYGDRSVMEVPAFIVDELTEYLGDG